MYFGNFGWEIYRIGCDKGFQDKLQIENELRKGCNQGEIEIVGDVVAGVVVYCCGKVCRYVVVDDGSCHKHLVVGNIEVDIVDAVVVAAVVDKREMRRFERFVYFG